MVIPVPGPAYRTAPGLFCLRLTIYAYFPRFILGWFAEQKRFALGKTGKGFMNHLVWNSTVPETLVIRLGRLLRSQRQDHLR